MKIAISALGPDLTSPVDLRFGRTPYFIIVETENLSFNAIHNPHMGASGGAGIQASQMIGNQGVEAVISGVFGPNAFQTLKAIGIPTYQATGGTVRETIDAFKDSRLNKITHPVASYPEKMGKGIGRGRGIGGCKSMKMSGRRRLQNSSVSLSNYPEKEANTNNELQNLKQQANQLREKLNLILNRINTIEQQHGA